MTTLKKICYKIIYQGKDADNPIALELKNIGRFFNGLWAEKLKSLRQSFFYLIKWKNLRNISTF